MSIPPPSSRDIGERLIGIELLRFAAAFGVLLWHYQNFIADSVQGEFARNTQPFYWLLAPLYDYGNAGVELFWCISGFIFTWKYVNPIHRGTVSFGRFFWLRFSRLYPLHFATLLLTAALNGYYFTRHGSYYIYPINDLRHFLLQLGFASQWGFQTGNSFNGPIWSVSVEILVYFLFFGVSRIRRGTLITDIGMAILASAIYGMLRRHMGLKLEVFGAITFFYIGAATFRLQDLALALAPDRRRWIVPGLAAIVAVCCGLVGANVLKIAGASLVMFPAAILLAQFAVRPRTERGATAIGFVGNLTYASYLIHFPLQIAMILVLEAAGIAPADLFYGPWLLLSYLTVVLVLSVPVFHGFERPAQSWLRSLSRGS